MNFVNASLEYRPLQFEKAYHYKFIVWPTTTDTIHKWFGGSPITYCGVSRDWPEPTQDLFAVKSTHFQSKALNWLKVLRLNSYDSSKVTVFSSLGQQHCPVVVVV